MLAHGNKTRSSRKITSTRSMAKILLHSIIPISALLTGNSYAQGSIITYSGSVSGQIHFNKINCHPRTNQDINFVSATSRSGFELIFRSRFYSISTTNGQTSFSRSSNGQGITWQHQGKIWYLRLNNVTLPSDTAPEVEAWTSGKTQKITVSGTLRCTTINANGT